MTENLTNKIVAWAAETGSYAAKLPSRDARETYLAQRREELVVGAVAEGASEGDAETLAETCVDAARAIMTELLEQRARELRGRA